MAIEPSSLFEETKDGSTLRIEWDNRQARKDRCACCFLVVFWIIWAPTTVFVTGLLLVGEGPRWFFALWLIFGWFGTLAIPYSFLGGSWREWIKISEEAVCHGCEGFLAPKPKCFPLTSVLSIFLGHLDEESFVTLNVLCVRGRFGFQNRHMLGGWLARDLKKELFDRIEAFVGEKELSLRMKKEHLG